MGTIYVRYHFRDQEAQSAKLRKALSITEVKGFCIFAFSHIWTPEFRLISFMYLSWPKSWRVPKKCMIEHIGSRYFYGMRKFDGCLRVWASIPCLCFICWHATHWEAVLLLAQHINQTEVIWVYFHVLIISFPPLSSLSLPLTGILYYHCRPWLLIFRITESTSWYLRFFAW